jgi:chaperonin GroES
MENKFEGQALNYVVIVEEVDNENITASGLDLTGIVDANEKQKKGKVVSVGTECPRLSDGSQTIKVGDQVIFDKFKMTLFTQKGKQYIMVMYSDLVWVG